MLALLAASQSEKWNCCGKSTNSQNSEGGTVGDMVPPVAEKAKMSGSKDMDRSLYSSAAGFSSNKCMLC